MKDTQTETKKLAKDVIAEQLFEDFYKKKWTIYWFNFFRGMFFGVGSIVGGTIVLAAIVWILSLLVDIPGGIGDFVQYVVDTVQKK